MEEQARRPCGRIFRRRIGRGRAEEQARRPCGRIFRRRIGRGRAAEQAGRPCGPKRNVAAARRACGRTGAAAVRTEGERHAGGDQAAELREPEGRTVRVGSETACEFCKRLEIARWCDGLTDTRRRNEGLERILREYTAAFVVRSWTKKNGKRNAGRTVYFKNRGIGFRLNFCPECGKKIK